MEYREKWVSMFFAIFITLTGTGSIGYNLHSSEMNEHHIITNTQDVNSNTKKIHELELKVAQIESSNFHNSDYSGVGICSCIKKENSTNQSIILCPTQNEVCDSEGRNYCEGILGPQYEC